MKKILLFLVSILLLNSCVKKEEAEAKPVVTQMTANEQKLIGKWLWWKTENNAPGGVTADTTNSFSFPYYQAFIDITSTPYGTNAGEYQQKFGNLPNSGQITKWALDNATLKFSGTSYPNYNNVPIFSSVSATNLILFNGNFTVFYYKK